MCGIVGVFNDVKAVEKVGAALALLQERGRDACGMATASGLVTAKNPGGISITPSTHALGHVLHAIIGHIPQPIKNKGILSANCEIYNWKALKERYSLDADNDSELLLSFLDRFGTEKLEELDGVYAFAYWRDDRVVIARDIVGVKPIWFSITTDSFAFASERKALERAGFPDIQELNPRHVLTYNLKEGTLETSLRPYVTFEPEHKDALPELKAHLKALLGKAIAKRVPDKKSALLFSGGLDSSYLALKLKESGHPFTCYTAAVESEVPAPDLIAARKAAKALGLDLKEKIIKRDQIEPYLRRIVPLIEDSNVVKVGVALTFYLACELAKEDGCKVIFSGLGSEEIFAGYQRHKQSIEVNRECYSGLLKIYERDLYRDDVITMANGMELRVPFLDRDLIGFALKIPSKFKLKDDFTKWVLRDIAMEDGLPDEFAWRKKKAAQYGSRVDLAIGKLAKAQGKSKSAYLRGFYPAHNLRLGALFSGGKDSTYATYVMKRQNYDLACLITLRSENPDSYMFHTPAIDLTRLQAQAMELPLVEKETGGEKESELEDLKEAIRQAKEEFKLDGIITGAVFSNYQRERIERICDALGLKVFSPLWHKPQEQLMRELLESGFTFVFSSIGCEGLDKAWLGTQVTWEHFKKLKALQDSIGVHMAGEGGEFESLVLDCPLFKKRLAIEAEAKMEAEHTGRLVVKSATLHEKSQSSAT